VKIHPHLLFPNHTYSVYVDGNIGVKSSLTQLVMDTMRQGVIAMYQHFSRKCLYDEARELAMLGHDWVWRIDRQVTSYKERGYPEQMGLFEASVIIRNHHDPRLIQLMEAWWQELVHGVRRDQISLGFLSWRLGIPIVDLGDSDPRHSQRLFALKLKHKRRYPLMLMIRGTTNKLFSAIWTLKTL
jgi:hypothetical protein